MAPLRLVFPRMIVVLAVFTAGVGIGIGAMSVVAEGENDTFYGCLTKGGDLIKVQINTAVACGSDQTPVNWNEQGPQGPAGVSGYEQVRGYPFPVRAGHTSGGWATCPDGKIAIGGGGIGTNTGDDSHLIMQASHPVINSTRGWAVIYRNEGTTEQSFVAYAICANAGT